MIETLAAVLARQDWNEARSWFLEQHDRVERAERAHRRAALWVEQLLKVEGTNPAAPFVREVQVHSHHALSLLSLGLLRPAVAEARAMVETALYYTYFREHPAELRTLARPDADWYTDKAAILDFHKRHTDRYVERASALGLPSQLERWYRQVSGLTHGQIPGRLGGSTRLDQTPRDEAALEDALALYVSGCEIVHLVMLTTLGASIWWEMEHDAKTKLGHGISAEKRKVLGLV